MAESKQNSPKVCIIGAGISGLCAGIKLQEELGLKTFTIYDENDEVGGTWYTHTYPGCACDVPSNVYSFSFELNPDWTTSYARQPEILEYLKRVAAKYQLYKFIKFNQQIKSVTWDDKINKWRVLIFDKLSDSGSLVEVVYDIIISGTGSLRVPNIPKEFSSFKGPIIHTATWDSNIKLEDKVVGIIGSGCSAVQVVPEIEPKVKQLFSFQRRAAWVVPLNQHKFPKLLKLAFAKIPLFQWLVRAFLFLVNELTFYGFKDKSTLSKLASWYGKVHLKNQIPSNLDLQRKLTPDFQFGCKRVSPSNKYYKSLNTQKSEVITSKITAVTDHSIFTEDGHEYKIDVLILATGYAVQDFYAPLKIVGSNSKETLDCWKEEHGPTLYLGIASSLNPNLFFLLGSNTASGNNSVIFAIECQVNWIVQVIREMQRRDSKVVCVKKSTENEYMKELMERMKGTVWGANECGSWYANENGIITVLYPKNYISYWRETRTVNFSKLDFE